ncbi:MAG TPA: phosphoribosylformylglycinamidine cyclo-ligase [Chloroflexota bacterium]|nr:phosphoribosylformylglycinamidine cyclo-ligase [Chloroflexota bacterium]HZU07923.1 phosphoribosylformylglycinamidine cyclo-ligase [Chloroflexota bacterium]
MDVSVPPPGAGLSYARVGVDTAAASHALAGLLRWVDATFALRPDTVRLPNGYFANVVAVGANLGVAISTDGVGTKLLVAQQLGKYDTVGIDCVAMNVNDVLCVGAEPVALVDYVAVERPDPAMLEALGRGLYAGAQEARVVIPGGELAQVPELLRGQRAGRGFDLVGTAIGVVALDRILVGQDIADGDVVVGLASSGIHSNGLTLARRALVGDDPQRLHTYLPELGRTLGEELLEPTRIYVRPVLAMLAAHLPLKALVHITGDGLFNLSRVAAPVSFRLERLPPVPPIFTLIQQRGAIDTAEMYRVFNMGVGFCVVVAPEGVQDVLAIAAEHGVAAWHLGHARADGRRRLELPTLGLVGEGGVFRPAHAAS